MVATNVLIVDDNSEKSQIIMAILDKLGHEYELALSSKSALQKLMRSQFDLVIIDLQLPEAPDEEIDLAGGVKLLRNIKDNSFIHRPNNIIGITSHKESYDSHKQEFDMHGWKLYLQEGDFHIIEAAISNQLEYFSPKRFKCDVAVITALEQTELEAVLGIGGDWEEIKIFNECTSFYRTVRKNNNGQELIILAIPCHGMGMAHSASITMKVCIKFSPKYILMVGIAAGIEGKVNLGDILIASICWDWGNGKQSIDSKGKPIFLAAPAQESLDVSLKAKLNSWVTKGDYLDAIYRGWPKSSRPEYMLRAHLGPIASGAVVLEDPKIVTAIKDAHRETIGIEMEAYGVMLAAQLSSSIAPKVLIIKSACDFADPNKNDQYQEYAAYTSAQYAFKVIDDLLDFS